VTVDELMQALARELTFASKYDEDNQEWVLDVQLEDSRGQQITLSPFEEGGRSMIRFMTQIGESKEFSPQKLVSALELNASLLYGALALYEGCMVLTETASLSQRDPSDLVDVVRYLTRMADTYEKMLFGYDRS